MTATAAFVVLSAYLLASWDIQPLYFSNQNTYFLQGLRLAGVEGLQNDWLSQTRSPHVAFSLLVAAFQSLGILAPATRLIEVALAIGLLWAFWIVSGCHNSRRPLRNVSMRFLVCACFLVLLTERGIWSGTFTWVGLADQYAFGGYLQPSEFGVAILVAMAFLSLERHRAAVACLVLAATFHVSYLVPCTLLAAVITGDAGYRYGRGEAGLVLAWFGVGVAPVAMYSMSFGGDFDTAVRARMFLAREVIPQHAWPARWMSTGQAIKGIIMVVGTAAAWRALSRPVALAMVASLLLIVVGSGYVYVSMNSTVALLFPWRASVYLYPLSLFCILVWLAQVSDSLAGHVPVSRPRLWRWGALALAALMVAESGRELTLPPYRAEFPFAQDVAKRTDARSVIIVPVADLDLWNRFRLLAMRPIYVDHKSHPYAPAEVLEWRRRIDAVGAFYRLPPRERRRRCAEMGANYYVSSDERAGPPTDAHDSPWTLVACT